MRIEHIRVDGFGRLADFDTGSRALGPLVVVLGPNEAGKSTLFSFLTTALYGFQPASRELSPHVPWGTDEAGGEIHVRLAGGERAVIARKLRSSPTGRLTVGETTDELRNHPVRWVEHVPRTVFRQVFAITLAELAGLDEDTWGSIQDRVLGSMGASDLRSAREVADTLEREAGEIWRPNRRGNQQLRELQAEIRALRSRRNEALERDRKIRGLVEERESVTLRFQDARQDRRRDKIAVERVQELLPLKRQMDLVASLREEGGSREELAGLPDDPKAHRARLVSERERLRRELEAADGDLAGPEAAIERFDEASRTILAERDVVTAFCAQASRTAADRARHRELRAKRKELEVRLGTAADHLLSAPVDDVDESVASVSVELVGDRITRFEAASRREGATKAERGAASGRRSALARLAPTVALVGAGAGLLAWGLSGGPGATTVAGAACLAVGVTLALLAGRDGRAEAAATRLAATPGAAEASALRAEIEEMLAGFPIRPEYLDPPAIALATDLRRVQDLCHELREVRGTERVLGERIDELDEEADRIRGLFAWTGPEDADELASALERALREAERARNAAAAAERKREDLRRTREAISTELARTEECLEELDEQVGRLVPDPSANSLDVVRRRLAAHARADRIEDEMERTHPNLPDLVARIRKAEERDASWAVDEDDLARRKLRIEELDETIETVVARGEALDGEVARLREKETVDAVDSEIASLQEKESLLIRERDRKWLLARLVREADRRFREEHQPDLIRRASAYLGRLTAGRYDRLLVDEDSDGDLFQLMGPQLPTPVPLARPISTGTLEQAYLSLRLAIVDHLDQGDERLPLFMDEAFVNWDDERRERGLEVLAEVSASRQVFAFTCHPEMAEDLRSRGACVLRLRR